jgi:hypothetical protein
MMEGQGQGVKESIKNKRQRDNGYLFQQATHTDS